MPVSPQIGVAVLVGGVALAALVFGARVTVQRSVNVAQSYGLSESFVGLTVVSIGTSLPEIAATVTASLGIVTGGLDYAVTSSTVLGGTIGSSVTQGTLLVGVFLLGAGTVTVSRQFVRSSYVPMVLATTLTLVLSADGTISRTDGLLLVSGFAVYLYYAFDQRERVPVPEGMDVERVDARTDALLAVGGLVVVVVSAYVLLAVVEGLVATLGLGGSLVGVVTLGVGAALPELTTVSESIRKRQPTLGLGTLVGSNVVNPLVAVGLGGTISTYRVPDAVVLWDLPFMLATGVAVLGYVTAVTDGLLRRRDGTVFVVAYFAFVTGHVLLFPGQ